MNSFSSLLPPGYDPYVENLKPSTLLRLVKQDEQLELNKKNQLIAMLNTPEALDHLLVGAAGMAITHMVAKYSKMSRSARILLGLAGFGIGNILYNHLHERKHTTYDPHTTKTRILL